MTEKTHVQSSFVLFCFNGYHGQLPFPSLFFKSTSSWIHSLPKVVAQKEAYYPFSSQEFSGKLCVFLHPMHEIYKDRTPTH